MRYCVGEDGEVGVKNVSVKNREALGLDRSVLRYWLYYISWRGVGESILSLK